ncbi:Heavy metal translocating P-type ATPase (plasmid) [Deinococcus geothermalis DSM 11300]|uniref:Heavy metal translocating P-type ATPase n=2 Tax=Deinococcaceae TaxID=183710 RepID=Q1J2U9_DEIGD|nr:Heavy metal translocating P-type ATPase [Deinococcus geothermalis DSM 11300]
MYHGRMARPAETLPSPAVFPELRYHVGGMDCASCVQKVERAVSRLPGTCDVQSSFTTQTLRLRLDERQTSRAALEEQLRALGYVPHRLVARGEATELPAPTQQSWFAGEQGRLVLVSGALLAAAWLLSLAWPPLSVWGYAAATLVGVWPLARQAAAAARLGEPFSINTLVTLAALGALLIGQAAEGAVVVFLFSVGELLEGVAAGRARAGVQALAALTPRTALLLRGTQVVEVSAESLRVGQRVQVRPGARVPADGIIETGFSALDDSPVTGESVPVEKGVGDWVYAGSVNGSGLLTVRVERAASDNTIARIIHLVEEAESRKAPTARLIDRFSRVYTPLVVAVSAAVATLPPLLAGAEWHTWLYRGLALLLIGCPCALVLSVPAAITSALAAGTRRGLLVKGGAALEQLASIRTVAFDKTGTLTVGQPVVTDVRPLAGQDAQEVLRLAAGVESGSDHPLAHAVVDRAGALGLSVPASQDGQALPGQGVSAQVEGQILHVVSPGYAAARGWLTPDAQAEVAALEAQGKTVVVLAGDQALGLLALRDEARADAREAVARLRALGLRAVMLTGDNVRTASAIAEPLGLEAQAGLLPGDKLRVVRDLQGMGGVAMVGDGINDAPALAAADVGIAMGGGTDVALETADAALLHARVTGVAELIELARAALNNIRQNVAFALGLKAVFLVTTLLGHTSLWLAILADTGATALVTANALRLLRWRGRP